MQNKPNFPHFSTENACLDKKQTQFKPNSKPIQTQFWPKNQGVKAKQTQFKPKQTQMSFNQAHLPPRLEYLYSVGVIHGLLSCILCLESGVFGLFLLIYNNRILNWIKSLILLKIVQNWLYQYKKTFFYSCNVSRSSGLLSKREELLPCQLTVALLLKAQLPVPRVLPALQFQPRQYLKPRQTENIAPPLSVPAGGA
jgi:hypothetical protein